MRGLGGRAGLQATGGSIVVSVSGPRRESVQDGIALLRGLLMSLPAAVAYLAGPELVIQFANDAYRELVGGREVEGRPLREAVPEVAEQGRMWLMERILRTGEPVRGTETEIWVRRHGQRVQLFVDFVYQPVRDAGGRTAGVLLYASDVTEHVRTRRRLETLAGELAESEERFRTLFETMPQGVIYYHADGSVIGANPAATRMLGLDLAELTTWPLKVSGQAVHEDGTPFREEDLPLVTALRTGAIVPEMLVGISHGRTGERRWLRITAVPDARDSTGRPRRAYGIFSDLTEQFRTKAALRESTAVLGRLREANVLGVMVATEDGIQEANDAFLDIVGYGRSAVESGRMSYLKLTPPEWVERDRQGMAELRSSGAVKPYDKEYLHRDGHRVPVLVGAALLERDPLRWVTFVVDQSARQRAERERAELLLRERAARAEASQARERLTFLLDAGALVAAARDRQALLQQVAELVVPSLADYCVVFLPAGDGMLRAAAMTHHDPGRAALLRQLRNELVPVAGPLIVQSAYTSGRTVLIEDVPPEMGRWQQAEPRVARILAQVEPRSAVAAPLLGAQQLLGVMVLGRCAGRPRFAAPDTQVVEELAGRLAAGLANADVAAREHTIAETLQRSLLPEALPEVPGLELAVRYLPATAGADVGGDWYDAFPVASGRIALVIGDVVGHSIASASVMGQVRTVLRVYAQDHSSPPEVLRLANLALARLAPAALATAVCAVLDPATGELSYASAGHPPPLLTGPGGAEYLDDANGIMLGAAPGAIYQSGQRRLPPGGGLLFYTDGLIEDRNRDLSEGLAMLARALGGQAYRSAGQICADAQDALLAAGPRTDDVCLLAVWRHS